MNQTPPGVPLGEPLRRKLWIRVLLMLLMAVAFQLAAWVLVAVAVLQLVLVAVADEPNARLRSLGGNLGAYLLQIAEFVSFSSDELPFPFNDWPHRERSQF